MRSDYSSNRLITNEQSKIFPCESQTYIFKQDHCSVFVYSQVNNGVLYVLAYVEDNLHQGPLAPRSSFQPLTLIVYNCTEYM